MSTGLLVQESGSSKPRLCVQRQAKICPGSHPDRRPVSKITIFAFNYSATKRNWGMVLVLASAMCQIDSNRVRFSKYEGAYIKWHIKL